MTNILIVTTNTSDIDGKIPTGVWYEEFAVPFLKFKELDYKIVVASPKGGKTPVDPKSISDENADVIKALENTKKLSEINALDYDCIYIPGGHGCMFDLPYNEELASIIEQMKHNRKVISTVCHGACGLIGAKLTRGEPYVHGKALTCFSDEEEEYVDMVQYMPFLLEDKLKELGANYMSRSAWSSYTIEDNYLITGQNQNSVEELTQKLTAKIERLKHEN